MKEREINKEHENTFYVKVIDWFNIGEWKALALFKQDLESLFTFQMLAVLIIVNIQVIKTFILYLHILQDRHSVLVFYWESDGTMQIPNTLLK
jgi:hypothetical protein